MTAFAWLVFRNHLAQKVLLDSKHEQWCSYSSTWQLKSPFEKYNVAAIKSK